MFIIEGCLGVTIGSVESVDEVCALVQKQIPVSAKKVKAMRNGLSGLAKGLFYHIEYGGTGCSILFL